MGRRFVGTDDSPSGVNDSSMPSNTDSHTEIVNINVRIVYSLTGNLALEEVKMVVT